jgi:hypothetical protein
MTHKFMSEPLRVLVKRDELTLEARARRLCRRGPVRVALAWRCRERAGQCAASAASLTSAALPALQGRPLGWRVYATAVDGVSVIVADGSADSKTLAQKETAPTPALLPPVGVGLVLGVWACVRPCLVPGRTQGPRTRGRNAAPAPPPSALPRALTRARARQGIKQFFVAVEREEWKFDTLCDLYDTLTITQAVIFCNTKRKARRARRRRPGRPRAAGSRAHGAPAGAPVQQRPRRCAAPAARGARPCTRGCPARQAEPAGRRARRPRALPRRGRGAHRARAVARRWTG